MRNNELRLALITPRIRVADVTYNVNEIIRCCDEASQQDSEIMIFPELAVTGATCGDLFLQRQLYRSNIDGIKRIIDHSKKLHTTIVFGAYLEIEDAFYNCTFIAEDGTLVGIVPKMLSLNYGGINFSRWFNDGYELSELESVETEICSQAVAVGDILFVESRTGINIMIKTGSDIFYYCAPVEDVHIENSSIENIASENIPMLVINNTADSIQTGMAFRRLEYYEFMSKKNKCAYAYVSPSVYESTTDLVFPGQAFVVSGGSVVASSQIFERKSNITFAELDCNQIDSKRGEHSHFSYEEFSLPLLSNADEPLPFIPSNKEKLSQVCSDAFAIQSNALATRFEHTKSEKALIGISGGLDSTLALLVTVEAFKLMGKRLSDIMTITMPGPGTSERTYGNALSLMKLLGTDLREISITEAVKQHFADIGHDINNRNKAFENAQARERTQILMDIANDVNGIVIGTGDLSESALGWCTFGGDHLAMYGVNSSIPKTFIPYIINWVADNKENWTDDIDNLKKTIKSVIETPISPELLPADERGRIAQKTEDSVGPYELHDYFIYHTMLGYLSPEELLATAETAFEKAYDRDTIKKWLKVFYQRFFSQQFKRNCSIDGPAVTHISLSPRGGLVMPSDAVADEWIKALEQVT